MQYAICVRDLPVAELVDLGRFAEDHGYRELWLPDTARGGQVDDDERLTGRDAFCALTAVFAATDKLRGGLGVAAVPMHQPSTLSLLASTLHEFSDGRFSLGIGVSHPELTAHHGIEFPAKPVGYMRAWLRALMANAAGGMAFGSGWPVLLAALGPRMVEMAVAEADGIVLTWTSPEHAAATVSSIRASAPEGRRPRTVVYLRLMSTDAARRDATAYMGFANYRRHFAAQGLTTIDEIVAATTLPTDDVGALRERLTAYDSSGVDLACIYPIGVSVGDRASLLEDVTRVV